MNFDQKIFNYIYRAKLSDEHYNIIKFAFPLDILENSDNLWEDITFANIANILKIYFSGDRSN